METISRLCSVEGCPNIFFAKTWCNRHYGAWRKTGNPLGLETERKTFRRGDAGEPRWIAQADALIDESRKNLNLCKVIDCPKVNSGGYGFCSMHYGRNRKYGRHGPVDTFGVKKDSNGYRINKSGYRIKTENSVNIYEHREVYENYLGRPLESHENIHHKNGDRADNRLENLELWITTQPSGQRVEDLVEWAKEILEKYDKN